MPGALEPDLVSTKQQRIAQLAQQAPQMGFFALAHHIDLGWLNEAFLRVRPDGATGVDGQTAADYEADLLGNCGPTTHRGLFSDNASWTFRRSGATRHRGHWCRSGQLPEEHRVVRWASATV